MSGLVAADEGVDKRGDHAPGPGLRQRKQARTRAELKSVADRLFDRSSFDQVTVEDICAAADLSPRTFFRYFVSKDEIVFSGLQEKYDWVIGELRERPPEEPAFDALRSVILNVLGHPDYEKEAGRVHRQIVGSPDLMRGSLATYRHFRDQLVDLVVERSPCAGDLNRARLLVGTVLVALEVAVDKWERQPDHSLRSELSTTFRQIAGVVDTLSARGRGSSGR
jgi:AcrR family transcriptional regulator